jgi:hypothetical protein
MCPCFRQNTCKFLAQFKHYHQKLYHETANKRWYKKSSFRAYDPCGYSS